MKDAARCWTTPADVLAKLRKKGEAGSLLAQFLADGPWVPIQLPIRGPVARELAADFDAVAAWIRAWAPSRQRPWRVDYLTIGGRHVGVNRLPARVWIDEPSV